MIENSGCPGPGITYSSQNSADTVQEFQDCISGGSDDDDTLSTSVLPLLDLKHYTFTTQLRPIKNRECPFENEFDVVHSTECYFECLQRMDCEPRNGRALNRKGLELNHNGSTLNSNGRTLNCNGRTLNCNGRALNRNGRALNRNGRTFNRNGRALNSNGRALDRRHRTERLYRTERQGRATALHRPPASNRTEQRHSTKRWHRWAAMPIAGIAPPHAIVRLHLRSLASACDRSSSLPHACLRLRSLPFTCARLPPPALARLHLRSLASACDCSPSLPIPLSTCDHSHAPAIARFYLRSSLASACDCSLQPTNARLHLISLSSTPVAVGERLRPARIPPN
jgi:hypothetical protein